MEFTHKWEVSKPEQQRNAGQDQGVIVFWRTVVVEQM